MSGYKHFMYLANMTGYATSKAVPMPKFAVILTGVLLIIGGGGIVLGIYIKFALTCLVIFFIGVTLKMHQYWKITDPMQKMVEEINFKKNLALLGAVLMLYMISPPWALSLYFR